MVQCTRTWHKPQQTTSRNIQRLGVFFCLISDFFHAYCGANLLQMRAHSCQSAQDISLVLWSNCLGMSVTQMHLNQSLSENMSPFTLKTWLTFVLLAPHTEAGMQSKHMTYFCQDFYETMTRRCEIQRRDQHISVDGCVYLLSEVFPVGMTHAHGCFRRYLELNKHTLW